MGGPKRLDQLDARQSARRGLKRPAAAESSSPFSIKGKSPKRQCKPKAKAKSKTARRCKPAAKAKAKAKAHKPTAKAKATTKPKATKPKATKPKAAKPKAAKLKAAPKRKAAAKATFARRLKAAKDPMASFWQSLRDAFEATVEPKVRHPSCLEEWGGLIFAAACLYLASWPS